MNFINPHEKHCFETATSFSAIRGMGSKRIRADFNTFDAAKEYAAQFSDKRTMVYAINDDGLSAHICNA